MSLKYSQIRNTIQTGDLLAWSTNSISSLTDIALSAYQKIYSTNISHVGIAVSFGSRVFVAEAIPPVVRLYPLSRKRDFYYIPCNLEQKDSYIDYLLEYIGEDYSLWDLVKSCAGLSTSTQSFYCSELAGDFYKYTGLLDSQVYGKFPHTIVNAVSLAVGKEPQLVSIDGGNLSAV